MPVRHNQPTCADVIILMMRSHTYHIARRTATSEVPGNIYRYDSSPETEKYSVTLNGTGISGAFDKGYFVINIDNQYENNRIYKNTGNKSYSFIPYYTWSNRGVNRMNVWFGE